MALFDERVQILTNTLVREGFGWVATEILSILETGLLPEETGAALEGVRQRIRKRDATIGEARSPDTAPSQEASTPLISDEQVRFAVDYAITRLSDIARSIEDSVENLQIVCGSSVLLETWDRGSALAVAPGKLSLARGELANLRKPFENWLLEQGTQP